jgi:RNA polymerase sigma-70 factor (ECF subfamily)
MPLENDDISSLYRQHAQSVLAYFARRTFDPEIAVDLMAETFASAFEDRLSFRGHGDEQALAWIYGIAHHRLAAFFRRGQVEKRALRRLGVERRPLDDWEYDRIEHLCGLSELREQIRQGLANLGSKQREVLRLRIVEERSYADVAQSLGVSEQTARTRVSRALRALRASADISEPWETLDHA